MFTIVEIQLIRQSLDVITILGKDAKIVANLQSKLEEAIQLDLKSNVKSIDKSQAKK
jgi:hypothetical protein